MRTDFFILFPFQLLEIVNSIWEIIVFGLYSHQSTQFYQLID